jgi:hypothetical protein
MPRCVLCTNWQSESLWPLLRVPEEVKVALKLMDKKYGPVLVCGGCWEKYSRITFDGEHDDVLFLLNAVREQLYIAIDTTEKLEIAEGRIEELKEVRDKLYATISDLERRPAAHEVDKMVSEAQREGYNDGYAEGLKDGYVKSRKELDRHGDLFR